MLLYCLKYRKNTESTNPNVAKAKNGRIMPLANAKCVIVKTQNLLKSKKLADY